MKTVYMKRLPILTVLFLCLICSSFMNINAISKDFGEDQNDGFRTISSVQRLDITSGVIVGERAEYTITVPPRWAAFLMADRERQDSSDDVLEKINFYFEPTDKVTKHIFLASIYIQDSQSAKKINHAKKIYETNLYIFSMVAATTNPLTTIADNGIFQQFLKDLDDIEMIAGFISTPKNQWEITHNAIKVNGTKITGKSMVHDIGLVYLPMREVCETLGYKIMWFDNEKIIAVERETRFEVVVPDDKLSDRQSFKAYLEDDICYVSVAFFIKNLALNCEIDENNNVYLSE